MLIIKYCGSLFSEASFDTMLEKDELYLYMHATIHITYMYHNLNVPNHLPNCRVIRYREWGYLYDLQLSNGNSLLEKKKKGGK